MRLFPTISVVFVGNTQGCPESNNFGIMQDNMGVQIPLSIQISEFLGVRMEVDNNFWVPEAFGHPIGTPLNIIVSKNKNI